MSSVHICRTTCDVHAIGYNHFGNVHTLEPLPSQRLGQVHTRQNIYTTIYTSVTIVLKRSAQAHIYM
jgi:hypothetical protein